MGFKLILLALCLMSASAFAADEQRPHLPTAQHILEILSDETLIYQGQYIPSYSVSHKIPTCVFRSSRVLLKYDYCVKTNFQAVGFTVFLLDDSHSEIEFYAETADPQDISTVPRKDYLPEYWSISAKNAAANIADMDVASFEKFDEKDSVSPSTFGCVTGPALSNLPDFSDCDKGYQQNFKVWAPATFTFWKSPPEAWYKLLQRLKTLSLSSQTQN